MKLEIQQRIEIRKEKEERNRMQKEENLARDLEKQRRKVLEEERQKSQRLVELENQMMRAEEHLTRVFLEEERKEISRRKEQIEKEKKEKEELEQRLRDEQERVEAEQRAENNRKVKEEQEKREKEIREEKDRKEKERRDKELKEHENQKLKRIGSKAQKGESKSKLVTGNLTERKGSAFAWGGTIEEPTSAQIEIEKTAAVTLDQPMAMAESQTNPPVKKEDSSEISVQDGQQPSIPSDILSHSASHAVGPIVPLALCDNASTLDRINSIVRLALDSTKTTMTYRPEHDPAPYSALKQSDPLADRSAIDSINRLALKSWKQWRQQHAHLVDRSTSLPHSHSPHVPSKQPSTGTTELKMSVENLQSLHFLSKYPLLVSLECNVNQITSLHEMTHCACSTSLNHLSLNDNQLTSLSGLESYLSLHSLHLDVNQLSDLSPIQSLPQLVTLSVKMNRLTSLPRLSLPSLEKFDLYHNRLSSLSPESLKSLSSLTHLDLGRNKLTTLSGETLSHCQLLSHLILSQNQLSSPPVPLYLPNLRSLWLSKNCIKGLDVWVSSLPSPWPIFLPLLEKLYLQDNEIVSIPWNSFVTSPLLTELDVSFNHLPDLEAIQGILSSAQLRTLQLQENPLLLSQQHIPSKLIQNSLRQLREFCGHPIDVKKGIYAPPLTTSLTTAPPLTTSEILQQKQLLSSQRTQTIRDLKHNSWKGNLSEIFRIHSKSSDCLELHPLTLTRSQSLEHKEWSHFLDSLFAEQNLFKIREKERKATNSSESLLCTSIVQLLSHHCHLMSLWDFDNDERMSLVNRVMYTSLSLSSFPLLSSPLEQQIEKRKDSTKEYHAVIRARQTHATLAIQSLWRGHSARKKLEFLLSQAKYYDADLEKLMDAHSLNDYMGILNESLPELSDDWLSQKPSSNGTNAMVYGDHKRKKMSSPRVVDQTSPRVDPSGPSRQLIPITPEKTEDTRISPRGQLDAARIKSTTTNSSFSRINGDWVVDEKKTEILHDSGVYLNRAASGVSHHSNPKIHETLPGEEEWEHEELAAQTPIFPRINTSASNRPISSGFSRPASSSSTISGHTNTSSSQRFGQGEYHGDSDDIDMLLHTGRSKSSSSSKTNEWGISNPTAVHNILKKNKLKSVPPLSSPVSPSSLFPSFSS
jgi:Leucine-rich repeat (LRR) protein